MLVHRGARDPVTQGRARNPSVGIYPDSALSERGDRNAAVAAESGSGDVLALVLKQLFGDGPPAV